MGSRNISAALLAAGGIAVVGAGVGEAIDRHGSAPESVAHQTAAQQTVVAQQVAAARQAAAQQAATAAAQQAAAQRAATAAAQQAAARKAGPAPTATTLPFTGPAPLPPSVAIAVLLLASGGWLTVWAPAIAGPVQSEAIRRLRASTGARSRRGGRSARR